MTIRIRQENTLEWDRMDTFREAQPPRAGNASALYLPLKRTMDILISIVVVVGVISWLLPLLMLVIVLESKGSPVFRQKRTGKNGRIFTCYKLRSMVLNPDSDTLQATDTDTRITRFGKFLRYTSLDELPQFFNVLKGDMSLVGPRPHMVYHTEKYRHLIPCYNERHTVKPGITGLAQVRGFRGPTQQLRDMENRVNQDLFYISNLGWSMDLRILLLTIVEMGRSFMR